MKLGIMNDPRRDVFDEIQWASENGFDFIDLTVEGPCAALESLDGAKISTALEERGLEVVGHTAWYLPFASPLAGIRRAAVAEVVRTFPLFAQVGARFVNVHLDRPVGLFSEVDTLKFEAESFAQLAEEASRFDLTLMVEHPPATFGTCVRIGNALAADERIGFHLDVGHAFVAGLDLRELLARTRGRLTHVHFSDNRGASDDHMPIGAGHINWDEVIRLLINEGYDATITLEVFCSDRRHVVASKDKTREVWNRHITETERSYSK